MYRANVINLNTANIRLIGPNVCGFGRTPPLVMNIAKQLQRFVADTLTRDHVVIGIVRGVLRTRY